MYETEKEQPCEGKELREYSVPEAKNLKRKQNSFKQEDAVYSVNAAEKQDKDGSMSIRYSNNEAISDLRAGKAGFVV